MPSIYFVITDREKVFTRQISLLQGDIGIKQSHCSWDEAKLPWDGRQPKRERIYGSPHGRRWESRHGLPHGEAANTEALGKQFCCGRRAHFWPRANYLFNISKTSTPLLYFAVGSFTTAFAVCTFMMSDFHSTQNCEIKFLSCMTILHGGQVRICIHFKIFTQIPTKYQQLGWVHYQYVWARTRSIWQEKLLKWNPLWKGGLGGRRVAKK